MRQPDNEKGGPIDNPTGDPMPEPSIFTDGNGNGPCMSVIGNTFRNIGHYGLNNFAIRNEGVAYIAPNNGRAVVRFNRIERCGGRHMNKAIYGDDGPYNAEVYCNIVSGTENDYDIDFRDMSAEPKSRQHIKITGTFVNTGNTISLNHCEGFVRIKDNHNDTIPAEERERLKCHFKNNAVLCVKGKSDDPSAPTKSDIAYKEGNVDEVGTSDSDFAKVLNNFIWEKMLNHSKSQGK